MAFIPAIAAIGSAIGSAAASASTAIGVGATILGAAGSVASGIAQSNAANYNAEVAQQQAKVATEQSAVQASNANEKTRQAMAAAQAGMLENGTSLAGSNSNLLDEMSAQGKLDMMTAVYSGEVRATGSRNDAALYQNQASNSLLGGMMGAGSKLLNGAADFYRSRSNSMLPMQLQV